MSRKTRDSTGREDRIPEDQMSELQVHRAAGPEGVQKAETQKELSLQEQKREVCEVR